jgi:hypothetical protein
MSATYRATMLTGRTRGCSAKGGQTPTASGSLHQFFLFAMRHAVIDSHLRLVKRCRERIS